MLGSTRGTALQAVIDAIKNGTLNAVITVIISNKSDAGILERAKNNGINGKYIPLKNRNRVDYDKEVSETLEGYNVQLVLMVGYMRIVSNEFVTRWRDRCVNVHPSLLPEFAGGMDLQVRIQYVCYLMSLYLYYIHVVLLCVIIVI